MELLYFSNQTKNIGKRQIQTQITQKIPYKTKNRVKYNEIQRKQPKEKSPKKIVSLFLRQQKQPKKIVSLFLRQQKQPKKFVSLFLRQRKQPKKIVSLFLRQQKQPKKIVSLFLRQRKQPKKNCFFVFETTKTAQKNSGDVRDNQDSVNQSDEKSNLDSTKIAHDQEIPQKYNVLVIQLL